MQQYPTCTSECWFFHLGVMRFDMLELVHYGYATLLLIAMVYTYFSD